MVFDWSKKRCLTQAERKRIYFETAPRCFFGHMDDSVAYKLAFGRKMAHVILKKTYISLRVELFCHAYCMM